MTQASAVLRDVFGFDDFRPGQKDIVDAVTQGENVLAIMPQVVENPFVINCLPYCAMV